MKQARTVIRIDEDKCNGCGLCVPSCAEGAIQIVDGKARLVSEVYCDGLGACLGECPMDAITLEEREADAFDETAVEEHLATIGRAPTAKAHVAPHAGHAPAPAANPVLDEPFQGCPGSRARLMDTTAAVPSTPLPAEGASPTPSILQSWPIQMHLVPVKAPGFYTDTLLLTADCVPPSFPDFQKRFLPGRTLVMGCPKLDDTATYLTKLTQILASNDIRTVEVLHMEVPCCGGLVYLAEEAVKKCGRPVEVTCIQIGIRGDIQPSRYA